MDNNRELIQKYIHKELSEEENILLDKKVANDSEFAEELEYAVFISKQNRQDRKQHWNQLLQEKKQQQDSTIPTIKPPITPAVKTTPLSYYVKRIAAILLIFALPLIAYFTFFNNNFSKILAQETAIVHYAPSINMGANDAIKNWEEAIVAYQEERYKDAAINIESIRSTGNISTEQSFYLGLSYFYQKPAQYTSAITHFKTALQNEKNIDQQAEIRWFQSLAHLQLKEWTKAKILLEKIIKEKTYKYKEAQQLLDKLPNQG